jgi:2-methylcitrate dehydratase
MRIATALQRKDFMTTDHTDAPFKPDPELAAIADYVLSAPPASTLAYETARYCLMDTLGCGLEALSHPACTKLTRSRVCSRSKTT